MNYLLGNCLLCLYTFLGILVVYNGVFVEPRVQPVRFRRQSEVTCPRLEKPAHGNYVDLFNTSLKQQTLPLHTILWYTCNDGFKLFPKNTLLVCLKDGGWSQEPPTCLKLCAPLKATTAKNVSCFDERNVEISCDQATDGATANFSCANYFETNQRARRSCHCQNGNWSSPPMECKPVCGRMREFAKTPLIKDGKEVKAGHYPWVAAIYKRTESKFIYICSGTMLSPKLIISAAHCVTNENGRMLESSILKVAVGKYYNEFRDARDTMAQFSEVQRLWINHRYTKLSQRFSALVTKDSLILSEVVQPACVRNLPNIHLTSSTEGIMTGWGFATADDTPSELKDIAVSYRDDTCFAYWEFEWLEKYYSNIEFCLGYFNSSITRCKESSGNGIVFKNPEDGRFYLHGILTEGNECIAENSFLYVNVSWHYNDLMEIARSREMNFLRFERY